MSEISFPEALVKIGAVAFSRCPLSKVTLPKSLETIGIGAFNACDNLRAVRLFRSTICLEDQALGLSDDRVDFYLGDSLSKLEQHVFSVLGQLDGDSKVKNIAVFREHNVAETTQVPNSGGDLFDRLSITEKRQLMDFQPGVIQAAIEARESGHTGIKTTVANPDEAGADTFFAKGPEIFDKLDTEALYQLKKAGQMSIEATRLGSSDPEAAIRKYEQVLEICGWDEISMMSIGNCLANMGRFEEGIGWLEKAVSADPDNARVKENLESIKKYMGSYLDKSDQIPELMEKDDEAISHNVSSRDINQEIDDIFKWIEDKDEKRVIDLLKQYPELKSAQKYGNTLLHMAAGNGTVKIIDTLLNGSMEVDLDCQNEAMQTPLHLAITHNFHEIINKLVASGAKWSIPDDRE